MLCACVSAYVYFAYVSAFAYPDFARVVGCEMPLPRGAERVFHAFHFEEQIENLRVGVRAMTHVGRRLKKARAKHRVREMRETLR